MTLPGTMTLLEIFCWGVCQKVTSCLLDLKLTPYGHVELGALSWQKERLNQNMIMITIAMITSIEPPKVYLSWSPDYLSTINSLFCLILYEFSVTHNWHNAPKINLYKCLLWLLTTAEMVIISNEKNEKRLLGWYLCWSYPANRKQFKSKSLGNSLLVGCFLVYATAFFCKCK